MVLLVNLFCLLQQIEIQNHLLYFYHLVNKAAYPCNEDNSFFEKISYYFTLGSQKTFENFRTIAFKHVPSKDKNGEYIMWLNDEKVVDADFEEVDENKKD